MCNLKQNFTNSSSLTHEFNNTKQMKDSTDKQAGVKRKFFNYIKIQCKLTRKTKNIHTKKNIQNKNYILQRFLHTAWRKKERETQEGKREKNTGRPPRRHLFVRGRRHQSDSFPMDRSSETHLWVIYSTTCGKSILFFCYSKKEVVPPIAFLASESLLEDDESRISGSFLAGESICVMRSLIRLLDLSASRNNV